MSRSPSTLLLLDIAGFAIVFVTLPLTFFGVISGWAVVDRFVAHREVTAFIDRHQQIVDKRLADPKVHAFSLSHDPDQTGTLRIHFDVDDKSTYEMLESDLDALWKLHYPPKWDTKMRSNEELSNNYGYAAWGISLLWEGMVRLAIAAIASIVASGFVLCLVTRSWRRQRNRMSTGAN